MNNTSKLHARYDKRIPKEELEVALAGGLHQHAIDKAKAMIHNFTGEIEKTTRSLVNIALGKRKGLRLSAKERRKMEVEYRKERRFYKKQLAFWQEYLAKLLMK